MLSLEIYEKVPVQHVGNSIYTGIEKTKNGYLLCDPTHHKIIEYDNCFQQKACYQVNRRITHITYCCSEKCYFAISKDECNKIFKLNHCFEEEDCYCVKTGYCMIFNGIDYHDGIIYLSCGCYILTLSLANIQKPEIWIKEDERLYSVAKSPCYLITSLSSCRKKSLVVYDNCKNLKLTCCLPCDYQIQDITCDESQVYILISKCDCYNFVLICQLQPHCYKEHCHYECNDVIESIALIETSLSHILNAEGEKLQKIIACSDDPKVILEVNDAVNRTITNVTHLEHVLYSKLETAKNMCEKKK